MMSPTTIPFWSTVTNQYECTCPWCGETIAVNEEDAHVVLERDRSIYTICPHCHESFYIAYKSDTSEIEYPF